jgi:hypothetical protein
MYDTVFWKNEKEIGKLKTVIVHHRFRLPCWIFFFFAAQGTALAADNTPCTYSTYNWSVEEKRAVNHKTVTKPYSQLNDEERDPQETACTVCREDQEEIILSQLGLKGIKPVYVCKAYKERIVEAMKAIVASGKFDFAHIVGYRVGRTRGPIVEGKRTQLSNHSFGTAIDINSRYNGLYTHCNIETVTMKSLKKCKLGIGGAWLPKKNRKKTIEKGGPVYQAFTKTVGWRWGGEISGKIRDLMHFSITGY